MASGLSGAVIDETQVALMSSRSYQASRGEQKLNVMGDRVLALSGSQRVAITAEIATNGFLLVKDQVSNFVENTKILVGVLDEVGRANPFIQAAVVIFKAGIQLELTRRENDEKVLALNITMCDMMYTLTQLKDIGSAEDRLAVKNQLEKRMYGIIESIRNCAKLCDSYQRRHLAIKFLTSVKWQAKFANVAEQFINHQKDIQSDLQLYISLEITNTNAMISTLNTNMNEMMKLVFELMRSPEEREFAKFVRSRGGKEAVLADEETLKEIMKIQQQQQQQQEVKKVPTKGGQQANLPLDLDGFRKELNKDVDTILAENSKIFDQRFGAIESQLNEVKGTIVRVGDRVVEEIMARISLGPHERIVDMDIYHVWKEMGWKGSAKATHFVMAVHDHFSAKSSAALNEIHAIAAKENPTTPTRDLKYIASIAQGALPATPAEDLWCLEYVTAHRAQPLIEALDDDGSAFITVNEVNAFTTSRPKGWSLPRWIAYWTMGFEMTTQWYFRRIRRLFSLLSASSKGVLPANRKVVSSFMRCSSIYSTQYLLSGLRDVDSWDQVDWVNDSRFLKFKDWVVENEGRMLKDLRKLEYYIDQDNTLSTVTRGARPEMYTMPLLYLLMKRSLWVMERAHDVVLHRHELDNLHWSMVSVHYALYFRLQRLQGIYKLQNIKKEEKLQNVFFGLYAYFEEPEKGQFWTQDMDKYNAIDDEPPADLDIPEPELRYEPQSDNEDLGTIVTKSSTFYQPVGDGDQEEERHTESLIGAWSGIDKSQWTNPPGSPFSFSITDHTRSGRFQCWGVDSAGPFTVNGRISGASITFLKQYAETQSSWRYNGLLNESRDEVSGHWGWPSPDDMEGGGASAATSPTGELMPKWSMPEWRIRGTFVLYRRPVDYLIIRPSEEAFRENKPRALWKLVQNAVKYRSRSQLKNFTWEALRERRDKRQTYMELFARKLERGDSVESPDDESIWAELVRTVNPTDLYIWRNIAQYKRPREIVYSDISCDHCAKSELQSTRMCIECSEGEIFDTIDLCSACQTNGAYLMKPGKEHTPSHRVIQLRRPPLGLVEIQPVLLHAKSLLESLADKDAEKCWSCEKELSEKPYWCCTECEDKTFVCIECNNRAEKTKPWLVQRKATPKGRHDLLHTMVLNTQPAAAHLSIDQRLAQLEAKLDQQAEENRACYMKLEKLEALLEQVVKAVTRAAT